MTESWKRFENALRLVGGNGRYQYICLAIASLQLLVMTWNHMGYIYIGSVPQHWCHISQLENLNWTDEQIKAIAIPKTVDASTEEGFKYDQCGYFDLNYENLVEDSSGDFGIAYQLIQNERRNLSVKMCESWNYDKSIFKSTIATEFNLVCGKRYLVASIQAFYMIGAFTGTLIIGPANDKILGRRRATLLAIILVLVAGTLNIFSVSYLMFIITRFIVAMGTAVSMQATSIWFLEHLDTKNRARLYCYSGMSFAVGYAIMPIYAYLIRDWQTLQAAFTITTLSLLSFYWIFPESPRWLASKGREEEAVEALLKMARINGVEEPNRNDLLLIVRSCAEGVRKDVGYCEKILGGFRNFKSLVATKELRRISFVMWALFVMVAFNYYGFAFSSVTLVSNPYLVVALGALMEIPAFLLPIPFLSKWGRRPSISTGHVLTGLSALTIAAIPRTYEMARMTLNLVGKLFVAAVFNMQYLVISEVYPTVVRTTGQGGGSLMGRIGSSSAPFVADLLSTVYPDLPFIIFGSVAMLASLVALLIPEMKDVDLKDQVHEYEKKEDIQI